MYFAAGEMYEIIKVCKTLFTAYVLLRKTQSSVSLRLIAPFTAQPLAALPPYGCGVPLAGKRGLWSGNETVCA